MNARRPERSLAAVRNKNGVRVLGPGQRFDGMTLIAVRATGAILQTATGTTCSMPVFLPAGERPTVVRTAPARALETSAIPTARHALSDEEMKHGIRARGSNVFAVSRDLLQRVLANPLVLRRSARVGPAVRNGRVLGMQLVQLRAQSPLSALGLKQGDILRGLNGSALSTPDGMLEALRMLRSASRVTLALLRDNAPQTVSLEVE
jgi:type II secretory pathway component PulC